MISNSRFASAALGAALMWVCPIWAHHSYSMFDFTKHLEISGTVHRLEWANPHVWLWIAVMDEQGAPTLFAFEGTSPGEMSRRNGWTKSTVSMGDKVTVKFMPFKDGTKTGGRLQAVTLPDGRTLKADNGYLETKPPTPPPQ